MNDILIYWAFFKIRIGEFLESFRTEFEGYDDEIEADRIDFDAKILSIDAVSPPCTCEKPPEKKEETAQ